MEDATKSRFTDADRGTMYTSEVNDKLVINKHPKVIVSGEGKLFTTLIGKLAMNFEREMIVVRSALISEEFTINREKTKVLKTCKRLDHL